MNLFVGIERAIPVGMIKSDRQLTTMTEFPRHFAQAVFQSGMFHLQAESGDQFPQLPVSVVETLAQFGDDVARLRGGFGAAG